MRVFLNGPQDARPGKFRFAYAESPAKQRRDRDVRGSAPNPSELGRIRILLAGVCCLLLPLARSALGSARHTERRAIWMEPNTNTRIAGDQQPPTSIRAHAATLLAPRAQRLFNESGRQLAARRRD